MPCVAPDTQALELSGAQPALGLHASVGPALACHFTSRGAGPRPLAHAPPPLHTEPPLSPTPRPFRRDILGPSDLQQRLGWEPGPQAGTTSQPRHLVTWGEHTLEEGQGGLGSTRPGQGASHSVLRALPALPGREPWTRTLTRGGRGEARAERCVSRCGGRRPGWHLQVAVGTVAAERQEPGRPGNSSAGPVGAPATRQCGVPSRASRGSQGPLSAAPGTARGGGLCL